MRVHLFKEISLTLQNHFRQHPQKLGRSTTIICEGRRGRMRCDIAKVFQLIKECLPTDEEWSDAHSNALPLFMVADSSCENCAASVIYDFLRRNAHALLANYSDEDSKIIQNRKCKVGGH